MTTEELVLHLKSVKSELYSRFGIEKIALFGSYARGEATEESDVDLVILEMKKKDYLIRSEAKAYLEQQLHKKIDMGYFDSMKTFVRNRIKKDLIYV